MTPVAKTLRPTTGGKSTRITLPDGSTLDTTGRSAAGVPPMKLDLEKGDRLYRAKFGDKVPPVH